MANFDEKLCVIYHSAGFSVEIRNVFKMDDPSKKYLDDGIYMHNRLFRLPLCTKFGCNLTLEIISGGTFQDAMVTNVNVNTCLKLSVNKTVFKTKLKPLAKIDKLILLDLEETFIENIEKFKEESEEYNTWISIGLKL